MIKYIPRVAYEFLSDNPNASYQEVARVSGMSERTARRYKRNMRLYTCKPIDTNIRAESRGMEELEDEPFDFDEFREYAKQMVRRSQAKDPVFNQDVIKLKVDRPIGVLFVSCMHLGGRYTAYDEFAEIYEKILQTPDIYWGSLGDDIEGYLSFFRDKSAIEEQLLTVSRQRDLLYSVLSPLNDANKLLFGASSQHGSDWARKDTGSDPIKEMYTQDFEVPFFDGTAYVTLQVGDQNYYIALSHEFKGNSMYNPNHPQKKALMTRYPNADVVIMGDKHTPAIQWGMAYPEEYEKGNRNSPYALLLQAGTAKTGLDKYTIKNWSRGVLEWPVVIFYPDEFKIEWTFSLDRAINMIKDPV